MSCIANHDSSAGGNVSNQLCADLCLKADYEWSACFCAYGDLRDWVRGENILGVGSIRFISGSQWLEDGSSCLAGDIN